MIDTLKWQNWCKHSVRHIYINERHDDGSRCTLEMLLYYFYFFMVNELSRINSSYHRVMVSSTWSRSFIQQSHGYQCLLKTLYTPESWLSASAQDPSYTRVSGCQCLLKTCHSPKSWLPVSTHDPSYTRVMVTSICSISFIHQSHSC